MLSGFGHGADVYITKPFRLSVLKAQIQALLARTADVKEEILQAGALKVDTAGRRFFLNGEPMDTTPREYEVLLFLLKNEKIVMDRNTILNNVWGYDYYGDDRTVDTIVKQLRKKLTKEYPYIKSVYGVGYYFEA
jgi:DNA-binding response OmpR family regulator